MTTCHVVTAARSIAAAQFARCGWDVSVLYGASKPEYDFVVVKGGCVLKIIVKGSQDGYWWLAQAHYAGMNSYEHIDAWAKKQGKSIIFCFVQFKDCDVDVLPRLYLATVKEIVGRLKDTQKGQGHTILYENHTWGSKTMACPPGTVDKIPDEWRFSESRIQELYQRVQNETPRAVADARGTSSFNNNTTA